MVYECNNYHATRCRNAIWRGSMLEDEKIEREKKLRALELKIRMRRFNKLKDELNRVKNYLLSDIEIMEKSGDEMTEEVRQMKADLLKHK